MRFELFIALRYLLAQRRQTFISLISAISVLGVAVGVAALIIVMGIMNGFTTDLRDKIMGVNAHAMLLSYTNSMSASGELVDKVRAVPGVTGAMPFIYSEAMLSGPGGFKGLILRGIDPKSATDVLGVLKRITRGNIADLAGTEALAGIIVGQELSRRIGAPVGSRVNLLTPTGQRSSAGFTPRIVPGRIVAVFSTGMSEYDANLGLISLDTARKLTGAPDGDWVTGLEVTVADVYRADSVSRDIVKAVQDAGVSYYARDWMEMNATLFAALQLEKFGMGLMVALIILVASFSIVTTLVMLVMEKTRDIAILMSMGTTRRSIKRIFMCQGLIIGAFGTTLGYMLGLGICWLLRRYQFIKLPKGVYSLDYLPVLLHWDELACIGMGAMLICYLATLYPARQAAGLEPVEALRYE